MSRQPSLLLVFVFVTACSSTDPTPAPGANTIGSCRAEFSVAKGYGYQNDLGGVTAPPPDGGVVDGGVVALSALDYAVATCKAGGGAACDPATFMTHDAAVCVAKLSGLANGIAGFKAGIGFNGKFMRVVWNVQNLTSGTPSGVGAGDTVTLDAVDGSLLAHGSWSATP